MSFSTFLPKAVLSVALIVGVAERSDAAIITWSGASGTSYNTDANWAGGSAPANANYGDYARFAETSPSNKTPTFTGNRSVQGVIFDNSVGWVLGETTTQELLTRSISSTGAGTNTISANLKTYQGTTTNSWTIGVGNTLNLDGALYHDGGSKTLNINGGGTLNFANAIGGWSSSQTLNINNGVVRIAAATPYSNSSDVVIATEDAVLQLMTNVASANNLISNGTIIDGTATGLTVTDIGGGFVQIAVPEPASLALIGLGGVLVLVRGRSQHG